MAIIHKWAMSVQETGKQISFTRIGKVDRESVCQIHLDGDVGLAHGVQGEHFFSAVSEYITEISEIVKYLQGHVIRAHVPIYKHFGLNVEWRHDCVIDNHEVSFIEITLKP